MRRLALPLALLAPLVAFAQTEKEPIEPVLVTFRNEAATLTGRWWKGGGSYTWNAVTADGSTNLLDGSGNASGLSLTCNGTICGAPGKLTSEQYADRTKDFPKGITTGDNGWVLNKGESCSFTLSGLDAQASYTLYVLAGRGNVWAEYNAETSYVVTDAELLYAENKNGTVTGLTQNTSNGNWLVFAVTFTGRTSVTVTATGGAGNFNAFALEGTAAPRWHWTNPEGGKWSAEANWANAEVGGDPWLLDLEEATEPVEITYDANPEPAAIRYDADDTAYVLKAGTFGAAFVDGEVAKDGTGTVTLTSDKTTADFHVAEGTLRVDGSAGTVTVAAGAAICGQGEVSRIVFQDGAVLDAAAGALAATSLAVDVPTLLDKSLPDGATLPATATVTVRNAKEGLVLSCASIPEGLTFVTESGTLEVKDGGLHYVPAPGYRLSLR